MEKTDFEWIVESINNVVYWAEQNKNRSKSLEGLVNENPINTKMHEETIRSDLIQLKSNLQAMERNIDHAIEKLDSFSKQNRR